MYSYIGAELTEATLQLHPPTDVGTSGGSNGASSTTEVARPYDEATLHLPTNVRSSGGTSGASSTTHDEVWLVTEVARPCDEVWLVTPDVMVHNERERQPHPQQSNQRERQQHPQQSQPITAMSDHALREQLRAVAHVCLILGGIRMDPARYIRIFGVLSPEAPYGSQVWAGMTDQLNEWRELPTRGSPERAFPGCRLIAGWFLCPRPFSRAQARADPVTDGPGTPTWYPAAFLVDPSTQLVYMWCLAIVIGRSHYWIVHRDRVVLTNYLLN